MHKSAKLLVLKAIDDALDLIETRTLDDNDKERLELKATDANYDEVTRKFTIRYKQRHNLRHAYLKLREFVMQGGLDRSAPSLELVQPD
jgi:hypothetical protein